MHHKIKEIHESLYKKIWDKRVIIVLLIAIFLIAFGIRGHLLRYDYLFEFDAFYHARLVEQVVLHGQVIDPDPLAYYQQGGAAALKVSLYHITSAFLYKILSFGQPYDREFLLWTVQFFPVVFGSIIALLLYFLGKEVFNDKKIGVLMAFMGAVTPAFAYRTMAGAQGDNSFGFIWMVLGFIFFVKAVKTDTMEKKDLINTALSGLFCGAMVLSWNMYPLIPLVLFAYTFFALLMVASREKENTQEILKNPVIILFIKFIIVFAIFHVIAVLYGVDWIETSFSYVHGVLSSITRFEIDIFTSALISFFAVIVSLITSFFISKADKEIKSMARIAAIMLLYLIVTSAVFAFITIPDLFYMNGGRESIASMVGEESTGKQFFGTKYNSLIIFPWLALILLPVSLVLYKKDDSHTKIIFFFWVLLTLAMAWYKLKFTFVFGLAIAPAAAVVTYVLFEGMQKFRLGKGLESKVIIFSLLLVVLFGVGASARFFPDYTPYVDERPYLKEAMNWIIKNTPKDAKILNWWDEGHILAWVTERKVSTDNRNVSFTANKAMADFVVLEDTSNAYEVASKNIGADYVFLTRDMFYQGVSFYYYQINKVTNSDPNVKKYFEGIVNILDCSINESVYTCGGNTLNKGQYEKLPQTWTKLPGEFYQGKYPEYIYGDNNSLLILNEAMNNSNLAKVWLNSQETKNKYSEVFSNGQIKIFKIIK